MRAARLLDMLLILQRRGRVTAAQLALELEVSVRTILRDVDALGLAGVPVVALQGAGGGIELVGGFRTQLTGLTTDEAASLFLVGQPRVAHRLGLGAPARTTRQKLLEALVPSLRDEAESLDRWFLHDPDPWIGQAIPHGELRRIAGAIERSVVIEITLADRPDAVAVEPLAIVHKAGGWYVVHGAAAPRALSIDTLTGTRITRRTFARPADFDVARAWDGLVARHGDEPAW